MPLISERDDRARTQQLTAATYEEQPTWWDGFVASASFTADEEASYSFKLNRENEEERKQNFRQLVETGVVDRESYATRRGGIDYNRLAADLRKQYGDGGRPGEIQTLIKTDDELREERIQLLAKRREKNLNIIERTSGSAQFFGAGLVLATDPLTLPSYALSLPYGASKSLSILGRALYTARAEASIGFLTEAAIQPLVFAHKNEIDSPYAIEDAITNVGIATVFSGGLGFAAGGVAGYFKNARDKSREGLVQSDAPDESDTQILQEFSSTSEKLKEARVKQEELKVVRDDFVESQRGLLNEGKITKEQFEETITEADEVVAYKNAKNETRILDRQLDEIVNRNIKKNRADLDPNEINLALELARRIDEFFEDRAEDGLRDPSEIYIREYQKFLDGRVLSLRQANQNVIKELEKQVRQIDKRNTKLRTWIRRNGGLNMQDLKAAGIDPNAFKPKEGGFQVGFWRKGPPKSDSFGRPVNGLRISDLNEMLMEDPTLVYEARRNQLGPDSWGDSDTRDWLLDRLGDPDARIYDNLTAEADDLRRQIDELSREDIQLADLEALYQDRAAKLIEVDLEDLRELQRTEQRMSQPTRLPEDYDQTIDIIDVAETDIQVKSVERKILADEGYSEQHDLIMADYRKLSEEERAIRVGDEGRNINELVEEYEKKLAGLDELVECTRSA